MPEKSQSAIQTAIRNPFLTSKTASTISTGPTNFIEQQRVRGSDVLSLSIKDNIDATSMRSCHSYFNKIEASEEMSKDEQEMHLFLDSLDLHQVNISLYLEEQNCYQSPSVKKEFSKLGVRKNMMLERRQQLQAKMSCNSFLLSESYSTQNRHSDTNIFGNINATVERQNTSNQINLPSRPRLTTEDSIH